MQPPFDISEYMLDEAFKHSYGETPWPAGAFAYQLRLAEVPDDKIEQLCDWLSINCNENYIVSMDTLEIISGGTTNNRSSWLKRGRIRDPNKSTTLKIRLFEQDLLLFRMVWIPN